MSSNNKLNVTMIHIGNRNFANDSDKAEKNIFFMPMGYFALGNILKRNRFNVEIIHSDLVDNKKLTDVIDINNVDIIGFDCFWVNQSLGVLETAQLIKELNPNIFIFLGGYTASLFSEEIIEKYPYVDAVIRGDGEVPIVELCNRIYEKKKNDSEFDLNNVQNLIWRTENNQVVANEFSYLGTQEEMEKLDFVDLETFSKWEYYKVLSKFWTKHEPISIDPMFFLEVGRGCSYACTFCGGNCEAQVKINNRKCSTIRSIDSVIETIIKAKSYGFNTFYTCFEYEGSDKWYVDFFKSIKNFNVNFAYGCWRLPSKELVDVLSESCNQVVIEISPESGNYDLRVKNKDKRIAYTNEELEACLDYINTKSNVKVQLYFGYFLAYDTEDAIDETLKYIMKLAVKYSSLIELEYFNFSTDPGSLLFFHPDKYDIDMSVSNLEDYLNFIRENYLQKREQPPDLRVFKPRSMTHLQVAEIERKVRLFNYLFENYRFTVSFILVNTKNTEIIMDIINNSNLLAKPQEDYCIDEFKTILINLCHKYNILDITLLKIIKYEQERLLNEYKVSKPMPQIWLDTNYEDIINDLEEDDDFIKYINHSSEKDMVEKELIVQFDF